MGFWPGTFQSAISISFDDGLPSQLNCAIPALNERGLRATFYLNPQGTDESQNHPGSWRNNLGQWAQAQNAGHEIGNHSVSHPCSLNITSEWIAGRNILEWSLERIENDILEAQKRILTCFPEQRMNSYAYPCYESTVGRGLSRISYVPVVARHFVAARAKGELDGTLANDPHYCDLHHLSSWPIEHQTGAFMIGLVELALSKGYWGIFTIHGIHESHLPIGMRDFVDLLDHLIRRKSEVWVAPVAQVGAYVQERYHNLD
jgi:peptidoglycan/xylan/chitin deacetylase (PgdA/CDA1 family)